MESSENLPIAYLADILTCYMRPLTFLTALTLQNGWVASRSIPCKIPWTIQSAVTFTLSLDVNTIIINTNSHKYIHMTSEDTEAWESYVSGLLSHQEMAVVLEPRPRSRETKGIRWRYELMISQTAFLHIRALPSTCGKLLRDVVP